MSRTAKQGGAPLLVSVVFVFFALGSLGAPAALAAEAKLQAAYRDGFSLEAAGGEFLLRLGGSLHFDLRSYQAEERGAPYSFDFRRATLDLTGAVFHWITFRLQAELADTPYLRNAWVDIGPWPWLHLGVGQMKVPFSTAWITVENSINFIERASSTPVYPFLDRGLLLWGELCGGALIYNVGAFTGAGIDADYGNGDVDDSKDLVGRLFLQPLRHLPISALQGLFLVGEATWGRMSVPTTRFETSALRSANFETAIWRWRTEQLLGTDGRVSDRTTAKIDERLRWGAELHYLYGPFAFSAEYLETRYEGIALYHELVEGNSQRASAPLFSLDGAIHSLAGWVSVYLTGEAQQLGNFGWKTAKPRRSLTQGGSGAFELLARYSRTWTARQLFRAQQVKGFAAGAPELPAGYAATTPGAGNTVQAAVLDGAHEVHELTFGLSWAPLPVLRLQLNDVFLWAPVADRDGDGQNDNWLLSGTKSDQADPLRKGRRTRWENAVMCRLIFRI